MASAHVMLYAAYTHVGYGGYTGAGSAFGGFTAVRCSGASYSDELHALLTSTIMIRYRALVYYAS